MTWTVACALRVSGDLLCLRPDGAVVPTDPGDYTFVDAGYNVVCAIRANGTSGCWRHDTPAGPTDPNVTRFDPITLPVEPGW